MKRASIIKFIGGNWRALTLLLAALAVLQNDYVLCPIRVTTHGKAAQEITSNAGFNPFPDLLIKPESKTGCCSTTDGINYS